jgi:hypothetical protein
MFVPALAPDSFQCGAEQLGHSSHCWCNCTLTETGPDDRAVGSQECGNERSCFEE